MSSMLQLTVPDLDGAPLVLHVDTFEVTQDAPVCFGYGDSSISFALKTQQSIEISVVCLFDSEEFNRIVQWRQSVYDSASGLVGKAEDYKKEGVLHFVGDKDHAVAERWVHGLWPKSFDPGHWPGNAARFTFIADLIDEEGPKGQIVFKEAVSEEEKAVILDALTPKAMRTLNRFGAVLAGGDG